MSDTIRKKFEEEDKRNQQYFLKHDLRIVEVRGYPRT